MVYTQLDVDKEEIRLLRFHDSLNFTGSSDTLCLSLENFSLHSFSTDFITFTKNGESYRGWHDAFFPYVEHKRGAQNERLNTSPYRPSQVCSSTRFIWGDYEALSYTWGDGKRTAHIELNGVSKEVSCELEAALRMLQRLPETQYGMKYWIDALCIQQDNIEEKNFQVKRMKNIYGTARSVVVWLGDASPADDIALQAINELWEDRSRNNWLIIPPHFDTDHWKALCGFLRKPYWSRLWIIQELAANPRSTLFVCGGKELTRHDLRLAARCCRKLKKEEASFTQHDTDILEISWRLQRLIDLTCEISKDKMLQKTLSLSRQAKVSRDKDRVYGILALLDWSDFSEIHPDYSDDTSLQDVFTQLTAVVIKATNSVEQIIYNSRYDPEWPSWVPDLRSPFLRYRMHCLRSCKASGDRTSNISLIRQLGTGTIQLHVEGIEIDYIDGVSASPGLGDLPLLPRHRNQRYNYSTVEILGKTLVLGDPEMKGIPVFMRLPWHLKGHSERSALLHSQEYLAFDKFRKLNQDFIVNGQSLKTCFTKYLHSPAKDGFTQHHLRKADISLKGRKLGTTETGYLGLVPDAAQRKDVLVILLGCNFPVLLRKYTDGYRVLDECYVHGLMAGEILNAQRREGLESKTFTLY